MSNSRYQQYKSHITGDVLTLPSNMSDEDVDRMMNIQAQMKQQKAPSALMPGGSQPGINMAAGLMSLMGGSPAQRELMASLPQIAMGKQPNPVERGEAELGKYLPSMATGSAPSLLGRLGAQGAMGAAVNPDDRIKGAEQGVALQAGGEALGAAGRATGSIAAKTFPEGVKDYLFKNLSGGLTLGQHSRDFAQRIKSTYESVKRGLSGEYDQFFKNGKLGDRELYPLLDKFDQEGKRVVSVSGGTKSNPLVKIGNQDKFSPRYYRETPDFDIKGGSEEFDKALEQFNNKPNLKNGHELHSELLSEERQRERQINAARGRGEAVTQQIEDLKKIKSSRQSLFDQMKSKMGDEGRKVYQSLTDRWKKNVIPYHGDRNLRDIVNGIETNPKKGTFASIFRNPDEGITQIINHLGEKANNDVAYQVMGKQPSTTTAEELGKSIKSINNSGFEDYLSKELKTHGLGLSKSYVAPALKGLAGVYTADKLISRALKKQLSSALNKNGIGDNESEQENE